MQDEIKPYVVSWAKAGCKVLREWSEPCKSGDAVGVKYMVEFINAKGNIVKAPKRIVWDK